MHTSVTLSSRQIEKLSEKNFETLYKTLRTFLYGRTQHGKRLGFKRGPAKEEARRSRYLHQDLQADRAPVNSSLQRLQPLKQAKINYYANSGKKSFSTCAVPNAINLGPSMAQCRIGFQKPKPGDWVECRAAGGSANSGILLGSHNTILALLQPTGHILAQPIRNIVFVYPDLAPAPLISVIFSPVIRDLLSRDALQQVDTEDRGDAPVELTDLEALSAEELDARREAAKLIRVYESRRDRVPLLITRLTLAEIYDRYRNLDRVNSASLSCFQAAQYLISREASKVHKDLHDLAYHAFRHMIDDPVRFQVSSDIAKWGVFILRPIGHVQDIETAMEWCNQRSPQFVDFVQRVDKRLSGDAVDFESVSDQLLLRILKRACHSVRVIQNDPYASLTRHIIAETSARTLLSLNRTEACLTFLKQIGVYPAWQNISAENVAFQEAFKEMHVSALQAPKALEYLDRNPLPRTKHYGGDVTQQLRKDYGQMPVYIIDELSATERDDGISIERAPDHEGRKTWWIHAHIADPATYIHPLHQASLTALRRFQTVYFPEATHRMIDEAVISRHNLSLGDVNEMHGQKTMTLSTRVDEEGEFIENDISSGIIRNPVVVTYNQVNSLLGAEKSQSGLRLTNFDAEHEAVPCPNNFQFDAQAKEDIALLYNIAVKLFQKRVKSTHIHWTPSTAAIKIRQPSQEIAVGPLYELTVPGPGAGLDAANDDATKAATLLVSEIMVLSNRSVARFVSENNIPVPYLTQPSPSGSTEALQSVLAQRDDNGRIPFSTFIKAQADLAFLPSTNSTQPGPHFGLGIQDEFGYCRATSPLRRYQDLYIHWHLKEALKPRRWRFNRRVDTAAAEFLREICRDSHKETLGNRANLHWTLHGIQQEFRKFEHGVANEAAQKLFGELHASIIRSKLHYYDSTNAGLCWIHELGIPARFSAASFDRIAEIGQTFRINIKAFELSDTPTLHVSLNERTA